MKQSTTLAWLGALALVALAAPPAFAQDDGAQDDGARDDGAQDEGADAADGDAIEAGADPTVDDVAADEPPTPDPAPTPPPAPRPAPQPSPAPRPQTTGSGTGTMSAGQAAATPYTVTVNRGRGDDDEEEEEEEEDEGDPYDFLILELFGGVSYVDLRAISANNYYPPEFVRLNGTGPMGGLALGFRLGFFTAGLRGSLAHYADGFDVGTATGEVMLALPIPVVKPYIRVGFGFGWHGDSNATATLMVPDTVQTTVFGWVFNGAAGLDIFITDWFAIGAAFSIDILNMNRQSWDEPVTDPGDVRFEQSGDAVGIQARGQGAISFHL